MESATPERMRACAASLLAFLLTAAFFLPFSGQAYAHAVLVSSSPSQGQRLAKAPSALTLRFSEPVTHVALALTDRYGRSRDIEATTSGAEVKASLKNPIADGAYALNWRAVSEDGHPVHAAVVFSVGPANGMQDLQHMAGDGGKALTVLTWLVKLGYYACALFGVGGTFFAFWIGGALPGRASGVLLWAACLFGVASLGLLGVEETASSLTSLISMDAWAAAIDGSFARSMALAAVSLLLSIAAILRPGRGRSLSLASILTIGPAFALTGHASGAGIDWIPAAALSVHVAAACFWAGALPRLRMILGSGQPGRSAALSRFSAAIPYSVAAILLPGACLAWIEVGSLEALWRTAYGNVLMAKLALVGCALLLGGFNRLFLTKGVVDGRSASARSMRSIVSAEVVLIALVLSVTALFRFMPPPRALAVQAPIYTSVHLHEPAAMATLSFWTRPDLGFDVEVSLADAKFEAFDPREVTLRMSSDDGSVAPFAVPIRRKTAGLWRADHVQAPCDCAWNVRVQLLVSDFDMVELDGRVRLVSGE